MISTSIRVVQHPNLSEHRYAIGLAFGGKVIAYYHNDQDWHCISHLCCPKSFTARASADLFVITHNLKSILL
jgi:hypothetical protein